MKSSKSLFNKTLFKSNISRFLPFSILFLIIELIIYPLVLFFNFNSKNSLDLNSLIPMDIASDVFTFFFAGAFSILVFGYLFSANKCNTFHAFPIGRKALFTTNLLSAYVLLVVPQLIGFGIAVPGIIMFAKAEIIKTVILLQLACTFLYSFIALSIGILAVMLSGNAFAGAVIYFILNFLYSALAVIASLACSVFGYGLGEEVLLGEGSYILSPVINLTYRICQFDNVNFYGKADFYKALIIYFALAFIICALAFLLYKLRELEVAGEMAAFEQELPFIRVIVSVIGGAVMAMFVGLMLDYKKYEYIALYIVFSFIVYFATQMILKRKFGIFSGKLILRWAICCAVSVGAVLGIAAYETNHIPEAKNVENINVFTTYNIEFKDEAQIKKAQEFQKALLEYEKGNAVITDRKSGEVKEEFVSDSMYFDFTFTYTLKNERKVSRRYTYRGDDEKINSMIKSLESTNDYENMFEYLDSAGVNYSVQSISVTDYNYDGGNSIMINAKDFDEVISLCKEDISAVTDNYSSLTPDNNSSDGDVWIVLTVPKSDVNVEKIESYVGVNFIEGYLSLDTFSNKKTYEIDMSISKLPKDSKVLQFAKAHQ